MNSPTSQQIQSTFTRAALYLEPYFRETPLSKATGFIIRPIFDGQPYLVTNWHVVSGKNADTDVCLHDKAAVPDSICVHHHSFRSLNDREPRLEQLYVDTDLTQPRWLEHPRGREVDVVLLPLSDVVEPVATAAIQLAWCEANILELPGLGVSVIGYPFGLHVAGRWPIWKTGHIASDPGYDYDDRPSFLIDITTREGMSGAPIVFQSVGPYDRRDGEQAINAQMQRQFLGIYSGRVQEQSELARGWRPQVIFEILEAHDIPYMI